MVDMDSLVYARRALDSEPNSGDARNVILLAIAESLAEIRQSIKFIETAIAHKR